MYRFFIILILSFCSNILLAQKDIDVSSLKAPSSPAFSILGIQPNQVTHPKTFNDLEVGIMNNFLSDGNFTIPKDFALEITPYWLFKHKYLTFDKYIHPENIDRFTRSISVSIATGSRKNESDTSKNIQQLAYGIRFQIPIGLQKLDPDIEQSLNDGINQLGTTQTIMGLLVGTTIFNPADYGAGAAGADATLRDNFNKSVDKFAYTKQVIIDKTTAYFNGLSVAQKAEYQKVFNSLLKKINEDDIDESSLENALSSFQNEIPEIANSQEQRDWVAKNVEDKIKKLNAEPIGDFLEFAFACTQEFPNENNTNQSRFGKTALWLTYTHKGKQDKNTNQFEFSIMIRGGYDKTLSQNETNLDLGGQGTYTRKDRFSLSVEFLGRLNLEMQPKIQGSNTRTANIHGDWRIFVNGAYRISEGVSITYGIGRDFNHNLITRGNLLSLLGLNFGIGNPKISTAE